MTPVFTLLALYLLITRLQEDIFKPNHYLSLMEFRELTLQRLKRFVTADFNGRRFDVRDYLNGRLDCDRAVAAMGCMLAVAGRQTLRTHWK
jgi:hypothetical protein